jgi:hypothetical protein
MRICWLGVFLIGCGGGGGGTSFEGIWRVDTWTDNPTACNAEGPPAGGTEPLVYVKNESILGESFINVNPCPDIATCKADANDKGTVHIGSFFFEDGSDKSGWTYHDAFAFDTQGQCEPRGIDATLTIDAQTFRIESRHSTGTPFPIGSDPDEPCPSDKAEDAIAGKPCDGFEVVTATFMEKF